MPEIPTASARLQATLAELEGRLANIAHDLDEPLSADLPEQASEMQDDASLEGQAALVASEIASVRRALDRIRDGEYGTCVECGGAIAEGRLKARPEAALCIACASEID